MTIQLAVANSHGIAMASDRHVYRGGELRSTGQDVKLFRLRSVVPAALAASGPLAVFETPVSRLAAPIAAALDAASAAGGPDELAHAVLGVFDAPFPGEDPQEADRQVIRDTAELVLDRALAAAPHPAEGLGNVLDELGRANACRGAATLRAACNAAWASHGPLIAESFGKPAHEAALRTAPELCGRAVVGALTRDWGRPSDLFVTVGMCCPATGVPVLVSLRLWRGLRRRLHAVSRFASEYEAVRRATRTVFVAQGSGRPVLESMIDGIADPHWRALSGPQRETIDRGMNDRWDRAHDRIGVASPAELGGIAAGLVRGAEAIGFLTRESEGTIAAVDCIVLTPDGAGARVLPAGGDAVWRFGETRELA